MGNNNIIMIGAILAIVLFASGFLFIETAPDGSLAFGTNINDVKTYYLGIAPVNETTVPPAGGVSDGSQLDIGVGYVDADGNYVVPNDGTAQAVYWAGTNEIVTDVYISPVLTVVSGSEVTGLSSVSYDVVLVKVGAKVEGDIYTNVTYGDSLTNTVSDLPAAGGPLGYTTMLGNVIYAIDEGVDGGLSDDALELFLWETIEATKLSVSEYYVTAGTWRVSIQFVIMVKNFVINYDLSDGSTDVYTTSEDEIFITTIQLDLEFVVASNNPPVTPGFDWDATTGIPNPSDMPIVTMGVTTSISLVFKPSTTEGTPTIWEFYKNGNLFDSGAWDGGDVPIAFTIYGREDVHTKVYLKVYVEGGYSANSEEITYYCFGSTSPLSAYKITGLSVSFSTFMPSSGGISNGVLLIGAGFFVLIIVGYAYNKNIGMNIKRGRRTKRITR